MAEQRKLAAIMFTDIVGYSALMSQDENKALKVLRKNRQYLKPLVLEYNGEWLKEMGDGTLSCFLSSVDAINCAIAIQTSLKDEPDLTLRIGLHTGDVVIDGGDIFGDGVNVASRIEPLTAPGGICFSEQLYDSIRNRPEISAVCLGDMNLKNVGRSIKIYALTVADLPYILPEKPAEESTEEKPDVNLPKAKEIDVTQSVGSRAFEARTEDHPLKKNYKLENYKIDLVLGEGSYGIAYKAWDSFLDCPIVLKEYLPVEWAIRYKDDPQVYIRPGHEDDYQYGLQCFLEEGRTLAKFKHHNIARVTNFIELNGTAYLVMEFEEGSSLEKIVQADPNYFDQIKIENILLALLRGLKKVHEAGVLHRDIKPDNIYIRSDGEPVLLDFGGARQALRKHSGSMQDIVTPGFSPSEQYTVDSKKEGPWSDLYALGATIYRCMFNVIPIESPLRRDALLDDEHDPLKSAQVLGINKYNVKILYIIDWMLKLSPKERPKSAKEVISQLKNVNTDTNKEQAAELTDSIKHETETTPVTPDEVIAEIPAVEPTEIDKSKTENQQEQTAELTDPIKHKTETTPVTPDEVIAEIPVVEPTEIDKSKTENQQEQTAELTDPIKHETETTPVTPDEVIAEIPVVEPTEIDKSKTENQQEQTAELTDPIKHETETTPVTPDEIIAEAAVVEPTEIDKSKTENKQKQTAELTDPIKHKTETTPVTPDEVIAKIPVVEPTEIDKSKTESQQEQAAELTHHLAHEESVKFNTKNKMLVIIISIVVLIAIGITITINRIPPKKPEPILYPFKIKITPSDSSITLPGSNKEYSHGMLLESGIILVRASKEGYISQEKQFEIRTNQDNEYSITLDEITLPLVITPVPENAEIKFLNIEETYSATSNLPLGRYHIEASLLGYETARKWVELTETQNNFTIELDETKYPLIINPIPEDAVVTFESLDLIYEPGMLLTKGAYEFTVSHPEFENKTTTVDLTSSRGIFDVILSKQFFNLELLTTPKSAKVLIKKIKQKYRPGIALKTGTYHLKISATGYNSKNIKVDLTKNTKIPVTLTKARLKAGTVYQDKLTNGVLGPKMVIIDGGTFKMGSNKAKRADEKPEHQVKINYRFAISQFEVTFSEYNKFALQTGKKIPNDEGWGSASRPVINVTYRDAMLYANWLSKETGKTYRLPTESEWEYAAGSDLTFAVSQTPENLCQEANIADITALKEFSQWTTTQCNDNYKYTAPVGQFMPNKYGLYDMHGNVWEWVADCYQTSFKDHPLDGSAFLKSDCKRFVSKGGAWNYIASAARIARRQAKSPSFISNAWGFRLVAERSD